MAKKKKKKVNLTFPIIIGLILGFVAGGAYKILTRELPDSYEIPLTVKANSKVSSAETLDVDIIKQNDFSIHFLEVGNKYTGDCSLVKANDKEVLIDAGSKYSSVETIANYTKNFIENDLDYIIITHAHEDHYAGFATPKYEDSLFSKLNVNENTTIITFSQITTNKASNKMYQYYDANLKKAIQNGATHYTCDKLVDNPINLSSDVTMKILDQKYYHQVASTENNHSVCSLFTCGSLNYLLTGDLEAEGEESLVQLNELPKVELYKAGHHGSKTSSSKKLMEAIEPKIVTVCCCAGSSEYTKTNNNQFPTQTFIDNVAPYTSNIFVTSLCINYDEGQYESFNGNIVVYMKKEDTAATVACSNNNTILKDTDWFKENRKWPN